MEVRVMGRPKRDKSEKVVEGLKEIAEALGVTTPGSSQLGSPEGEKGGCPSSGKMSGLRLEETRERIEVAGSALAKQLGAMGGGSLFVERLMEFFKPGVWVDLDNPTKMSLMRLWVKVAEIAEGSRLTVRLEGEQGATAEEIDEHKEALLRVLRRSLN